MKKGKKILQGIMVLSLLTMTSTVTVHGVVDSPPEIHSESPSNSATGISVTLSQVSVYISDDDHDLEWSIEVSTGDSASGTSESSGTKTCSLTTPLEYGTTYTWWVNASTDLGLTNKSYTFTTIENQPPTITYIRVYNSTLSTHESLNSTNISILPDWFNVSISDTGRLKNNDNTVNNK